MAKVKHSCRNGSGTTTGKLNDLRQSRRLIVGTPSKGFDCAQVRNYQFNLIGSRCSSTFSWSRMYALTTSSSRPTVETKYPLAQKFSPVKFLCLPLKLLAMRMAALPLIKPTTFDTGYLGGIRTHTYEHDLASNVLPRSRNPSFWQVREKSRRGIFSGYRRSPSAAFWE